LPDEIYDVVSQAARYWFLFLMALIAWRSFRWLQRDRKQKKRRLKLLPDAGYVGELVVLQGNDELPEGLALPVGNEGILGCLRNDDVYVPVGGVARKHLWYEFDEQFGLRVRPYRHRAVEADGQTLAGWRSHADLTHGSQITVGSAVLKLRLFAGFEHAGLHRAVFTDETRPVPPMAGQPQPAPAAPFTPEQMVAIQQMQYTAAAQALQAAQAQLQTAGDRNVLSTQQGDFVPPPRMDAVKTRRAAEPDDAPSDDLPPDRPPRASRLGRFSPLPPLAAEAAPDASRPADARGPAEAFTPDAEPETSAADEFSPLNAPDSRFYPPVMDEDPTQSDPYVEADDPRATGEPAGEGGEAPKSFYVEPDEAEIAKRILWDKYLKGGRHS